MQSKHCKLFSIVFLLLCLCRPVCFSETIPEDLLIQADQLFAKKKYTESYKIYNKLYIQDQKVTPQSLLKMALIKEGLGEYADALYFLNSFYEHFPDKKIFNKMKEIAEKEKLSGYNYSDLEFFSNLYRTYHDEIIFGILALVFVYFLAVITNKIFIKGISKTSPFVFILFLLITFYITNFAEWFINPTKAVVLKDKSLIMEAPSAASKPLGFIEKGNRVVLLKNTDIWSEIRMDDKTGFIRTSSFNRRNL